MTEKLLFDLPPEVEACDMVVVYDRKTGAIRHTHECFTWRGGEHPSREAIEREAMEHAGRIHRELGEVEALHVDPRTVELDALHHVDVNRRALVAGAVVRRGARGG